MENNIQIFKNEQFGEIRTIVNESGEPMFCLADVCKSLGLTNPTMVKQSLKYDALSTIEVIDNLGRKQQATFINEGNLYKCIFQSRKPDAEKFQDWMCFDVAPSIRKNGAYMTGETLEKALTSPDFIIGLALKLKEEQKNKAKLQAENEKLRPKAELMDKVLDSDEKIDIGQAAKILQLPFGRNTLFQKLREKGIFFNNRNEPKQDYVKRGYFELKEKWIDRNEHDGFMVVKVLVTQRGLEFIAKMFEVIKTNKRIAVIQ